jgi:LPXTG-motif cell wall-anchored protein
MKKRLVALLGAIGLTVAGALALASPASATPGVGPVFPICSDWQMRSGQNVTTNEQTEFKFGDAAPGATNTATTATLVKPADLNKLAGTEFVGKGLYVRGPAQITVHFEADAVGASLAGAIRLFGYYSSNVDTQTDAPNFGPDIATSNSGDLSLTVPSGKTLRTLGFTYDGSNDVKGKVVFSKAEVVKRGSVQAIRFDACPPQPPTHETDGPTCDSKDMKVTIKNGNVVWPVAVWIWIKGDPEPMRVEAGAKVEGTVTEATRYGWAYEKTGAKQKMPSITEKTVNGDKRRVGDWTFVDVKYTPADCSTPPTVPPVNGGGGGGGKPLLPVTGAEAGLIGSIGGAIVVIGAALFVAARKRRIRTVA